MPALLQGTIPSFFTGEQGCKRGPRQVCGSSGAPRLPDQITCVMSMGRPFFSFLVGGGPPFSCFEVLYCFPCIVRSLDRSAPGQTFLLSAPRFCSIPGKGMLYHVIRVPPPFPGRVAVPGAARAGRRITFWAIISEYSGFTRTREFLLLFLARALLPVFFTSTPRGRSQGRFTAGIGRPARGIYR